MQVEKLTSDSEHLFPDCDNFSGSNHSNFILGIVGRLYMLPRLLKNIYSMCTHQAHMGFDLKNKFGKIPKFWQKFRCYPCEADFYKIVTSCL